MKISRSRYQKAKTMLQEMRKHQETVRVWESAMKRIGDTGNQIVKSIEIDDDGAITTECEMPAVAIAEKKHA